MFAVGMEMKEQQHIANGLSSINLELKGKLISDMFSSL
jgi:hypothetical protein